MNGAVVRFTINSAIPLVQHPLLAPQNPMDALLKGNKINIIFVCCQLQNQLGRRLRRLVQDIQLYLASTSLL